MPESVVKGSVIMDTTQLQEGVQTSVEGLQQMAEQATVTSETMKSKSQAMAEAAQAASVKITAADLNVAKAAQEAAAAKKVLADANRDVKNGAGAESDAITLQALAMKNAREAAVALAAAQAEVTVTGHKAVTDIQATSGAVRAFEGNPGIRAMENFIGKTLGLGPLMQNIFPFIGAAAFGTVLVEMGEKFYDMTHKALNAGSAIRQAFDEMHDRAIQSIDSLTIQNDKLEEERAKLSGHPGNGLKLALDEARKAADDLLISLKADNKELAALLKDNAVGMSAEVFTNVASTGTQAKEMLADQKKLQADIREINSKTLDARANNKDPEAQKRIEAENNKAIQARFQSEIDTYRREANRLVKEETDAQMLVMAGVRGAQSVNNSAKIADVQGYIDQLKDRQNIVKIQASVEDNQQAVGQLKQDKQPKGEENKAAEQQLRNIETQLAEMNTKLPEEALAFWQRYVGTFKEGSSEYLHVIEQVNRYTAEFGKSVGESSKLKAELARINKRDGEDSGKAEADRAVAEMNKLQVEQAEDVTRSGERWAAYNREVEKGSEIAAAHVRAMQEIQLKAQEAMGSITPLAAAQRQAAIDTEEHTAKLKLLREELDRLKQEGANLKPGDKGYEKNQTQQQSAQNAITQEIGAGQQQGAQNTVAIQNAVAKPYLTAFNQINDGWLKVQKDLIQGNKNIGRDFAQMGLGMVQSMAANAEKMLASWAQMEIRKLVIHQTTTALNNAVDAAGAATSIGIAKAKDATTGLGAAKTAFKNTYASVSGWPVVGPVMAPVLAAGAFAAVAAFEQGTMNVPRMGMALLHPGEAVLGSPAASVLREKMSGGGGGGGGDELHFHMGGNTIQGGTGTTISDREFSQRIKKVHRLGHLKDIMKPA